MSSDMRSGTAHTAVIVADAVVLTTAAFCLLAVVGAPFALVVGPALAWVLHGHRLDRGVMMSGVIGIVAAIAVVGGVLVLIPRLFAASVPSGGSEFAGPIALLGAFVLALVVLVVVLDIDGIRDLLGRQRVHARLDIARLASTAIIAIFSAVVGAIQHSHPETEIGDAGVFALAAGVVGGIAMLIAVRVERRWHGGHGDTDVAAGV